MICAEVREYLFAFIDNELDAPLSIELQRHLDVCHDCAREVEIERAIRKQLTNSVAAQGAEPPLEEQALINTLTSGTVSVRRARTLKPLRWVFGAVGVAAALLIAAAWLWTGSDTGPDSSSRRFVDLLVDDFQHFLEKGKPLQLASNDPVAVSEWLRDQTGLGVALPRTQGGRCKLVGARKCRIAGNVAAFAVYEMNGRPASLVVMDSNRVNLDGMEHLERNGQSHWVDRCRSHTVVACRRGDLTVAAVAQLPEEQLVHLMSGAVHESN